MKHLVRTSGISFIFSIGASAAEFTIGGFSIEAIRDTSGDILTTNSIIQIGYFDGVSAATDPSTYTPSDWESFVAISGIDSLNPSKVTEIDDSLGLGTYTLSVNYDTLSDSLPAGYPVRLGVRVFDSTSTTSGANYNTVSSSVSEWQLLDHEIIPTPFSPNLIITSSSDTGLAWQDGGANAFKTTIVAVPEPASFTLLGLGALGLVFRRRR